MCSENKHWRYFGQKLRCVRVQHTACLPSNAHKANKKNIYGVLHQKNSRTFFFIFAFLSMDLQNVFCRFKLKFSRLSWAFSSLDERTSWWSSSPADVQRFTVSDFVASWLEPLAISAMSSGVECCTESEGACVFSFYIFWSLPSVTPRIKKIASQHFRNNSLISSLFCRTCAFF